MDGYNRDSLRALRREQAEGRQVRRRSGSVWITLLIVVLFLGAGFFYLKTTDRLPRQWDFSAVKQTVVRWREEFTAVFHQPEAPSLTQTVDQALAEEHEEI